MTKKHFIALADAIREHNRTHQDEQLFNDDQLDTLAQFCRSQNYSFNRSRWLDYIAGNCGPGGGAIKTARPAPTPEPRPEPLEMISTT